MERLSAVVGRRHGKEDVESRRAFGSERFDIGTMSPPDGSRYQAIDKVEHGMPPGSDGPNVAEGNVRQTKDGFWIAFSKGFKALEGFCQIQGEVTRLDPRVERQGVRLRRGRMLVGAGLDEGRLKRLKGTRLDCKTSRRRMSAKANEMFTCRR